MKSVTDIMFGRLQDAYDDYDYGDCTPKKKSQKEIFKELEGYNIEDVETFLRIKKLNKLKKKSK